MQSLAHNDRSHYMWDGIVCLADKPKQKQARACARVCVCASVRVVLHAGENAHLREPKTEPSCILLYAPFRGLSVTQRGESLHVALQCSNRKLDVSVRAQWLRRNWLKYPLKVTVHANVCPWGFYFIYFFFVSFEFVQEGERKRPHFLDFMIFLWHDVLCPSVSSQMHPVLSLDWRVSIEIKNVPQLLFFFSFQKRTMTKVKQIVFLMKKIINLLKRTAIWTRAYAHVQVPRSTQHCLIWL